MKHLKIYERLNNPEIDDYVFCQEELPDEKDKKTRIFLVNNIGKIVRYRKPKDKCDARYMYIVSYEYVPQDIVSYFNHAPEFGYCRAMSDEEIKYWAKDKETVEAMTIGNKYNL